MKRVLLLIIAVFSASTSLLAQDNVAEIAHSFIKAIKSNDIKKIENRFLDVNTAYPILPKESVGLNAREKNNQYIQPLYAKFSENFEKIQTQIKEQNINVRGIDLRSYKLGKKKNRDSAEPIAMSIFFNYNRKEHLLPIRVVEIDEHWYIMEILKTTDLFE
jgi:hypothetical protein